MNETTLDAILAETLDAVLAGECSVADCLARYPQHAADLKPLLLAALLARRVRAQALPDERVAALERRLRAYAGKARPADGGHAPRRALPRPAFDWGRLAAALVIAVLLAFGGGAGMVAASDAALPGETLYPVKRWWESASMSFARVMDTLPPVSLSIADERLWEVGALDARLRLTVGALRDLAGAALVAAQYNTPQTMSAFQARVTVALGTIQTPGLALAVQQARDVVSGAAGIFDPPALPIPTLPAVPPSVTPSATADVLQAVQTAGANVTTIAPLAPPPLTPTPLFPATPTRTPTPTVTATVPAPTPVSGTFTPTWTPLPRFITPTSPPPVIFPTNSTLTPTPTFDGTMDWTLRATQRSVYLTQTAGPPPPTATPEP